MVSTDIPGIPPSLTNAFAAPLPDNLLTAFELLARQRSGAHWAPDEVARLSDAVSAHETKNAKRATALLGDLDPRIALKPALIARASSGPGFAALESTGLNRFLWIIGTASSGANRSKRPLSEFFQACAVSTACKFLLDHLHTESDLPYGIQFNPGFEQVRRTFATDVRLAWISQLIAETTAEEIAKDPSRFGAMNVCNGDAVADYFNFFLNSTWETAVLNPTALSEGARQLAKAMSLPAGSLAGTGFSELVSSTKIERYPFVAFDELVAPLAAREATLLIEQPLFELARQVLAEKERSDLYERVVSRAVAQSGPQDFQVLQPPLSVPIAGTHDLGETDFAFASPSSLLLGEAKAYFITAHAYSVVNAFSNQMGSAVTQLSKRIGALRAGGVLSTANESVRLSATQLLVGVAAPLHSYATAAFNLATLEQIGADRIDIAIIPLHQLLMVMRTMRNSDEFARYIAFRYSVIAGGIYVYDEADILRAFLAPLKKRLDAIESGKGKEGAILLPYHVEVMDALLAPRPGSAAACRAQLRSLMHRNDDLVEAAL